LGLWAATACAADPWQNARIMPKSQQLLLRAGREFTGDVYQIEWPATVERIEGQWLWIADHGGYRVPSVAGWVSKDEVLKVAEAQDCYLEILQTTDAPWIHWLLGICLEQSKETETAQEEYARCLNVSPRDGRAVQMAVAGNANLLDAAVRLGRLQADAAKSVAEVAAAADLLQNLSQTAGWDGIRRPYVLFEQAEALCKAFRSKVEEERKSISAIDAQIDRANSERGGGAGEARELFQKAEEAYQRSAAPNPGSVCAGPHCWKGNMGRAELYLNRIAVLEDEAWSLIAANASAPAPSAAKGSAHQLDVATTPLDLTILDGFLSRWQSPQQKPALAKQADAICVCLAEEIRSLRAAIDGFNAAVLRSPDQIEAYRDRGLAYLALARCEATLAVIEKTDRDLQSRLASLYPGQELSPQRLDCALVEGRKQFNEAVDRLSAAKANEAAIAAKRKSLAKAAPPSKPAPPAIQEKPADAAKALEQLDQAEKKAKEELSQADVALDESYTMLSKSANLRQAERSAETACQKGNLANTESLKILAAVFAAQCNFDRAEFYQKMATTFASDDERRQIFRTLSEYRQMGEQITRKAKAKTAPSPPGQGKGEKPADGGQADDAGSDD
jgi:hypothetical protein